jgi:DNA topoisomerase IA
LGVKLIEALEKYSPIIIDENLTRQVEEKTEAILEAKSNWKNMEDETIKRVEQLITDISKEFKVNELSRALSPVAWNILHVHLFASVA